MSRTQTTRRETFPTCILACTSTESCVQAFMAHTQSERTYIHIVVYVAEPSRGLMKLCSRVISADAASASAGVVWVGDVRLAAAVRRASRIMCVVCDVWCVLCVCFCVYVHVPCSGSSIERFVRRVRSSTNAWLYITLPLKNLAFHPSIHP